jgi:hypothetical protein
MEMKLNLLKLKKEFLNEFRQLKEKRSKFSYGSFLNESLLYFLRCSSQNTIVLERLKNERNI